MNTTGYQMRVKDGRWYVFLVRVGNREVPRDKQEAVYGPETQPHAQVICDTLNRGLLVKISAAVRRANALD